MTEAFKGGGDWISLKAGNNDNFQEESSLSRDNEKGEESSNVVSLGKNCENDEGTSHLHQSHKVLESDNPECSKQFAESPSKTSKNLQSKNFAEKEIQRAENNEEKEQISQEKKFGKIESIDKFINLHFDAFEIEGEFIDINNFDSKDLEKRALDLDVLDASEAPVNYKYNRTQNQTTRGFWNKKKEAVEAQLEQAENEANNGEEIDSDDEESVPFKDLVSCVENIKL